MSEREQVSPEFLGLMNAIATTLNGVFAHYLANPGVQVGWALLVFDPTSPGRVNYSSNGDRDVMIAAVEEWLKRAKADQHGRMN